MKTNDLYYPKIGNGIQNPRDHFLTLVDDGLIDARHALLCCVKFLGQNDCAEIMRSNELISDRELYGTINPNRD